MNIVVDPTSPTPPYEQIRQQLITMIRDGGLLAGTRLPTVRRLASDLGLAPNTIARAYRELERVGAVETRGRHGTFVATGPGSSQVAAAAATAYAARMRELGVDPTDALQLVARALQVAPPGQMSDMPR